MKPKTDIFVHDLGNVAVFYKKVKDSSKSVWLQKIGTSTKQSPTNSEHGWEVEPDDTQVRGEVFRKLKTPSGRVRMSEYSFLAEYVESVRYTEASF